jgi:hypothetical protein
VAHYTSKKTSRGAEKMNYIPRPADLKSDGKYRFTGAYNLGGSASYRATTDDYVTHFYAHLNKWRSETYYISSAHELMSHRSFKAIVGMGEAVLPLILDDLKRKPSMLILSLSKIQANLLLLRRIVAMFVQ